MAGYADERGPGDAAAPIDAASSMSEIEMGVGHEEGRALYAPTAMKAP